MKRRSRPNALKYMREYRAQLRDSGLCPKCKAPLEPGFKNCLACREKNRAYCAARYADPAFAAKKAKDSHSRYLRRLSCGRCPRCRQLSDGRNLCSPCLEKERDRRRPNAARRTHVCKLCEGRLAPLRHNRRTCPLRFYVGSIDEYATARPGAGQ